MLVVSIVTFVFFLLLTLGCLVLVVLGLPGTWIMILLAGILELCDKWIIPGKEDTTFGLHIFVVCLLLASLGELLEFLAGVLGAKKFGASTRGMVGALVGGLAGALLGVAIPVPIVGSIIGAVIGTFLGALAGEMGGTGTRSYQEALKPATGATLGKILGVLSKVPIALTVWFIFCGKLFLSAFVS